MRNPSKILGVMLGILVLAGCSSFERQWRQTRSSTASAMTPVVGKWEGSWRSEAEHGGGSMRAIVVAAEAPSSASGRVAMRCSATFKSTFWSVFSGTNTVDIIATPDGNGRMTFHGSKDLGILSGGVYTYDGWASESAMESTYSSSADHGVFKLRRAP